MTCPTRLAVRPHLALALLALIGAACNAVPSASTGAVGPPQPPPAPQAVAVAIDPATVTVPAAGQQQFQATVTGAAVTTVTWTVDEPGAAVSAAGLFTAPGAAGTFHVRATSTADTSKSAAATVTVTAPPPPVTVAVTPPSATMNACQTLQLSAAVNGTTDQAVTWSVVGGAANGTVSAAGVYTAPDVDAIVNVVATSHADPTKTAIVPVTVKPKVLSVTVTPPTVTVAPNGTATFTATVTTTCGTSSAKQTIDSTGAIVAN